MRKRSSLVSIQYLRFASNFIKICLINVQYIGEHADLLTSINLLVTLLQVHIIRPKESSVRSITSSLTEIPNGYP